MRIKYEFTSLAELAEFFDSKAKDVESTLGTRKTGKMAAVLQKEAEIWKQASAILKDAIISSQEGN